MVALVGESGCGKSTITNLFLLFKEVINAVYKAMEEGKTKYTSNEGIIELREAISKVSYKKIL